MASFHKKRPGKEIDTIMRKILIVGGGNLGYFLSQALMEDGYSVSLIEKEKEYCRRSCKFARYSRDLRDGTMVETLARGGAGKCDTLIAVTGKDEDNLIACELAKQQFNVPQTVARVNNPKNMDIMKKLGVDITMSPTRIIAGMIEHEVEGAAVRLVADINNSDASINEYKLPEHWSRSGATVQSLNLPEDCVLIYLMRDSLITIPRGNTALMEGDEIVALTVGNTAKTLKKIFEL